MGRPRKLLSPAGEGGHTKHPRETGGHPRSAGRAQMGPKLPFPARRLGAPCGCLAGGAMKMLQGKTSSGQAGASASPCCRLACVENAEDVAELFTGKGLARSPSSVGPPKLVIFACGACGGRRGGDRVPPPRAPPSGYLFLSPPLALEGGGGAKPRKGYFLFGAITGNPGAEPQGLTQVLRPAGEPRRSSTPVLWRIGETMQKPTTVAQVAGQPKWSKNRARRLA